MTQLLDSSTKDRSSRMIPAAPDTEALTVPKDPRRRSNAARRRALIIWRGVVGAAAVAVVYQIITMLGLVDAKLLPGVPAIAAEVGRLVVDPAFLQAVGDTMAAVAVGLFFSLLLGVGCGLMLGASRVAGRATRAPIDILRSLPSVAMIPLFLMTLGDGLGMKTVVVILVAVWPILLNTSYAARSVDSVAKDAARSLGMGRFRVWAGVVVPSAAPGAATGFLIAVPMALTVAISAEMAAGTPAGIGGFILQSSYQDFDAAPVFAAVVLAGLIGWALNEVAAALTSRFIPWEGRP